MRVNHGRTRMLCLQSPAWLKKPRSAWPYAARLCHRAIAAMPLEVKPYQIQVGLQAGFFSTEAIVKVTNPLPDLVKQAKRLQRRVAGLHDCFITV